MRISDWSSDVCSSDLYKPLSVEVALAENAALPFSTDPVERAPPLVVPLTASNFAGRRSAMDCLTAAIYYEAAQESESGKRGVAQVVLNRARHPAFPSSIDRTSKSLNSSHSCASRMPY